MNLNAIKAVVEPLIKPAVKEFSNGIVKSIDDNSKNLQDAEVVYIIFNRNNKPVIAPAIVDNNNHIKFSNELNENLFSPQALDKFILDALQNNK